MDENDQVYSIIVAMAETLVPDVCRIIMDYLEQIHIDLGRLHWREAIIKVNAEYESDMNREPEPLSMHPYYWCKISNTTRTFIFNWRSLPIWHGVKHWVHNKNGYILTAALSPNY